MKCPVCKGENLQCMVIQENRARTYWVCQNCANKFRDPQDLEKEIAASKRILPGGIVLTVLGAVLTLLCLFVRGQMTNTYFWTSTYRTVAGFLAFFTGIGIFIMIFGIIFIILGVVTPPKLEKERADILAKIGMNNQY